MKLSVVFSFLLLISCQASRNQITPEKNSEVVYGEDNRKDYFEITDPELKKIARSTVALIAKENLVYDDVFDLYRLEKPDLGIGLCDSEPFRKQPTWAFCSGSLIGPDLILTAGHCVFDEKTCRETKIVLDYALLEKNARIDSLPGAKVYACKQVLFSSERKNSADFAILRLDHEVTDRPSLLLSEKPVEYKDSLMLIGHPAGYPTKFTFDGKVRNLLGDGFFKVEIDAFSGNSGSSVFDQQTLKIVGVLARGENDYDRRNGCLISKVCEENGCRGEDVTRIEEVKKYLSKSN